MKRLIFGMILVATLLFAARILSREAPSSRTGGLPEVGPFADFYELLEVGEPAPDFALETPEGEEVSLESLRGKWVVIEFGART